MDRTAVIQSMFSEPIILSPLIGWLLGVPLLGIQAGILMQLFFLGAVSIGGSSPPDGAMASLVVVGSAGLSGLPHESGLLTVSILLLMIPASRFGRGIEEWIKEQNVALAHKADRLVAEGGYKAIERLVHRRLVTLFAGWSSAVSLGIMAGTLALILVFKILSTMAGLMAAISWVDSMKVLPLVAAGIALSAIKIRRAGMWYAVCCVGLLILSMVAG